MKATQISKDFPDCFHRVTIKGLCVREGKLLLIFESFNLSEKWEMPGGGLDFGEDIKTGLKREIKEEMGLEVSKISKTPVYVWTYKYVGKRGLDWYYSLVVAYRIEFKNLDFTPTDECTEIKFFSKEEIKDLELSGQSNELVKIFNPKDFEGEF